MDQNHEIAEYTTTQDLAMADAMADMANDGLDVFLLFLDI